MNLPVCSRFIDLFNGKGSHLSEVDLEVHVLVNVVVQFFFIIIVSHLLQNVQQITVLMVEHATWIMESRPASKYLPLK